jgi:hypothetical protein
MNTRAWLGPRQARVNALQRRCLGRRAARTLRDHARQAAQSAPSAPGGIWQRQTTHLTGPDQVTDLRGRPAIRPRTSGEPEGPAARQNHRASTRAPPPQPTPCTTAGRCGSRRRREAPHHLLPGQSTERSVLRGLVPHPDPRGCRASPSARRTIASRPVDHQRPRPSSSPISPHAGGGLDGRTGGSASDLADTARGGLPQAQGIPVCRQ